ncbi:uridine kinase [Halobacillus dabanensis]|uniref:Uridine kinase n=1 Tax=Halobacillus dabanensis TaxID=240302 RepID=A0A1I3XLL8_HALDA|nr:AAA family ATPase [Halobacillus dabanensis]SFK20380.1 uridine kinase [Halobacillus dabanensis]
MNVEKVLDIIQTLKQEERFVLGIDGLSRSGKTSFTQKLVEALEKPVLTYHIDDYIVDRSSRYKTGYEEWYEYYHLQWDVKRLQEELFQHLRKESEKALVIIEGVFLQRAEWRDYLDYVVYLKCSKVERFNRESQETQEKIEKFLDRYWKAEDYYMKTVNPERKADLVL